MILSAILSKSVSLQSHSYFIVVISKYLLHLYLLHLYMYT